MGKCKKSAYSKRIREQRQQWFNWENLLDESCKKIRTAQGPRLICSISYGEEQAAFESRVTEAKGDIESIFETLRCTHLLACEWMVEGQ